MTLLLVLLKLSTLDSRWKHDTGVFSILYNFQPNYQLFCNEYNFLVRVLKVSPNYIVHVKPRYPKCPPW